MNSTLTTSQDTQSLADLRLLCKGLLGQVSEPALLVSPRGELLGMNRAMHYFAWARYSEEEETGQVACYVNERGERYSIRDELHWLELLSQLEPYEGEDTSAGYFLGALSGDVRYLHVKKIEVSFGELRLYTLDYTTNSFSRHTGLAHDSLFMHHSSAMMLIDPQTLDIVQANEAAALLYETSRTTLAGMNFTQLEIEWSEAEDVMEAIQGYSVRQHAVAGERRLIEIYGSLSQGHRDELLFLILHDVTEREEAQMVLSAQESLLSHGGTMSQIGCWEWNIKTGQQTWTGQTYKVFGVESLVPFDEWIERVVEEDRLRLELFFEHLLDEEESENLVHHVFRTEYRWMRPDDKMVDIDLRVNVEIDEQTGEILFLRGSVQDISELRERERESQRYAEKLEQLNQSLEDFASMASHDLREPLRKVVAFGERLAKTQKDVLDARGKDYLDRILSAGARMHGMIDSLLELAMCSKDVIMDEERDLIDVNELLEEVCSILEVRIEEQSAEIDCSGVHGVVMGNRDQLIHVFQNLLSNALKFHHTDMPPQIEISCESILSRSSMLRITVRDHGIGMSECFQDEIFKPFRRLHGKKSNYEGHGIGLAICKKIVENHGGRIYVESAPADGSKFYVELPCERIDGGE